MIDSLTSNTADIHVGKTAEDDTKFEKPLNPIPIFVTVLRFRNGNACPLISSLGQESVSYNTGNRTVSLSPLSMINLVSSLKQDSMRENNDCLSYHEDNALDMLPSFSTRG